MPRFQKDIYDLLLKHKEALEYAFYQKIDENPNVDPERANALMDLADAVGNLAVRIIKMEDLQQEDPNHRLSEQEDKRRTQQRDRDARDMLEVVKILAKTRGIPMPTHETPRGVFN